MQLTTHFFKLKEPSPGDFLGALNRARVLLGESKVHRIRATVPIVMVELEAGDEGNWWGDIARGREKFLPSRLDLSNGEKSSLDLESTEALGEHSAFLYVPHSQILALQNTQRGVSHTSFGDFFRQHPELQCGISLLHVRDLHQLADIMAFDKVIRFEAKMAKVDPEAMGQFAREHMEKTGMSIGELTDRVNADQVTVVLSSGRRKAGLVKEAITRLSESFLGLDSSQEESKIQKIRITGSYEDERSEGGPPFVDLIAKPLSHTEKNVSDENREVPYAWRRQILHTAYDAHKEQLTALYGSNSDS